MEWAMIAGEVSHSCVSCLGGTDDEMDLDQGDMVTSESECENCGQVPAWIIRVWVDNFGLFLLQLSLAQHLVPACVHLNRIIMLSLNLWCLICSCWLGCKKNEAELTINIRNFCYQLSKQMK